MLRMVEQYLHPDVFRAGVREYLRQHAYANATTDDLWVAPAGSRNVSEIMEGWIRQPGFPLISVSLDKETNSLCLSSSASPTSKNPYPLLADGAQAAEEQDRLWQVPIELRTTAGGETTVRQLLLKDVEQRLEVPEGRRVSRVVTAPTACITIPSCGKSCWVNYRTSHPSNT